MRTPHFLGVKALQMPAKSQISETYPLARCAMAAMAAMAAMVPMVAMACSLQGPGGRPWQGKAFVIRAAHTSDFSFGFLEQVGAWVADRQDS